MSEIILILGGSGGGKSRSILNLPPKKTIIINLVGKRLPFIGAKEMYSIATAASPGNMIVPKIGNAMNLSEKLKGYCTQISKKKKEIKYVVLDDFQYLMSTEFMQRAAETGWTKFTDIAKHAWEIIEHCRTLREDLFVYFLTHTEQDGDTLQMKTIGKLLREKITPEGYFSIVLLTDPKYNREKKNTKYRFRTFNKGKDPVKAPEDMFPRYIDNDLKLVSDRITEFDKGVILEDSKLF